MRDQCCNSTFFNCWNSRAVRSPFFKITMSSKAKSCKHDERVEVARVCCAARLAPAGKPLLGLGFGEELLAMGSLHEQQAYSLRACPPSDGCFPGMSCAAGVIHAQSWSTSTAGLGEARRRSLSWTVNSAFTRACQGTISSQVLTALHACGPGLSALQHCRYVGCGSAIAALPLCRMWDV